MVKNGQLVFCCCLLGMDAAEYGHDQRILGSSSVYEKPL